MRVYNAIEAAEVLRINGKWAMKRIERLCREGKIRAAKPSNRQGWRIHEKALEDYLLLSGGK